MYIIWHTNMTPYTEYKEFKLYEIPRIIYRIMSNYSSYVNFASVHLLIQCFIGPDQCGVLHVNSAGGAAPPPGTMCIPKLHRASYTQESEQGKLFE